MHSNPAGGVGGEQNHETNNPVRTSQRVRLGLGKCEKQVSIAYNSAQLKRSLTRRRSDLYTMVLVATVKVEEERRLQQLAEKEQEMEEDEDILQHEFRMADDAGAILDPYLGDDFVEIIMEEGMI